MRVLKNSLMLITFFTLIFTLMACNSETTTKETTNSLIHLNIGETEMNILVGEEGQITVETNDTLGVTYTSSDTSILTVDADGNINGVQEGEATVTVKSKLSQIEKQVTITVMKPTPKIISLKGDSVINVGSSKNLEVFVSPENASTLVIWESTDPNVLDIDKNGKITGLSAGEVKVTARSKYEAKIYASMFIKVQNPLIVIGEVPTPVTIDDQFQLTATLSSKEDLSIKWVTSDEAIATVDANGLLTAVGKGLVTVTASLVKYPSVKNSITINIFEHYDPSNLLDLLALQQNLQLEFYKFKSIGYSTPTWTNPERDNETYQSVSNYYFGDIKITQDFIPTGSGNRPGLMTPLSNSVPKFNDDNIFWVVVHDTGDTKPGATAKAMANYVNSPDTATSWHFTVDENDIYQHLPENERAFHAGDGSTVPTLIDTGVQAGQPNPSIRISADGYYELNGVKSTVKAPGMYPITPNGIYTTIGNNGNYFIMDTYYNGTYKVISNVGGNRNGIGIEMAINDGSDIFRTWQKTAKLVAQLLVRHNLPLEQVKFHQDFSGKLCPQTLIRSTLAPYFKEMVALEYEIAKNFKDAEVSMKSLTPEFLDNSGRIIKAPSVTTTVKYEITVKLNGETQTRQFESILAPKAN